ncbi:hypothetical protein SteCoe_20760 [Stentor coeruleus]|uniref:5-formyltetrahydrofolate cyclo-ligase n=1 Tax=Stentor coeruleus TaxID=5963 RepID=A0A1R2BR15_9CILI|nr:hypothetical protein SteCoe_20760 [Stentor coeruleus]
MQKSLLRSVLKAKRAEISHILEDYKPLLAQNTIPELLALLSITDKVAGYYPINSEFDCLFILKSLIKHGIEVSLPVVGEGKVMKFKAWNGDEALLGPGKFGVPIPICEGNFVDPDMILVPMLGFNNRGYRIGYGGAFYDNTLPHHPRAKTIGLAFKNQLCEEFQEEPHDVKLNSIITEEGVFPLL